MSVNFRSDLLQRRETETMLLADYQKQRENASWILQQFYIIPLRELIYGSYAVENMYRCFCARVIVKVWPNALWQMTDCLMDYPVKPQLDYHIRAGQSWKGTDLNLGGLLFLIISKIPKHSSRSGLRLRFIGFFGKLHCKNCNQGPAKLS